MPECSAITHTVFTVIKLHVNDSTSDTPLHTSDWSDMPLLKMLDYRSSLSASQCLFLQWFMFSSRFVYRTISSVCSHPSIKTKM